MRTIQMGIILSFILAGYSICAAQTSDYQYADFNRGQNDRKNTEWVQKINVLEPAYRSDIQGNTTVKIKADSMTHIKAFCWKQPDKKNPSEWGHRIDLTPKGIKLTKDGTGSFIFPADEFPSGPVNIRIFASNEKGEKDMCELQLYNRGGITWNQGIPEHDPPAAKGLQLVFSDDFDGPLSISNDGRNARYCAHKPPYGDFSGWPFSDVDAPGNPFEQRDTYLRIKARKEPGSKGSTGIIASIDMEGKGFWTKAPFYMECRFTAQSAPGTWPAFWTLTTFDGSPTDELDIIEAYGGRGPGHPNHDDVYCIVSHFWNQKKQDGTPPKEYDTRVPMTQLAGKSGWSETFHTYGLYVGLDETVYYFNDIEVLRHPTNDISREKPTYFLLNYSIGGISGWPIDLERYGNASDMYIDYIRVYAKEQLDYKVPR